MRLIAYIAAALLLLLTLAGCGGKTTTPAPAPAKEAPKFVSLLTVGSGDTVALDPDTVKAAGQEISVVLHFTKREIKNGVKSESWDATLKPSERLISLRAKMLYNEAGQVMAADTAGNGWEYIIPDSDTEKILVAVVNYCKSRGLAVNAMPPPYALPGFKYIAKSTANNAFYLYKPSSVRADGNVTSAEVLMIHMETQNGAKYALATVNLRARDRHYQTAFQTLYDGAGKKLSDHRDGKWYAIPEHSIYDMLLYEVQK